MTKLRVTRERLPKGWAAIFINAEEVVVINSRLSDEKARKARRLMARLFASPSPGKGRRVGAYAIVKTEELAA